MGLKWYGEPVYFFEPSHYFYTALLPDVAYDGPESYDGRDNERYDLLDKNSPMMGLSILQLPCEVRELIYQNILGRPNGCSGTTHRMTYSSMYVAQRVRTADVSKDITVDSSGKALDHIKPVYCPTYTDRDYVMKYFDRDQYYWLESCAQRMEKMGQENWQDFRDYFFRNTILDLRYESGYEEPDWDGLAPMSSHLWLQRRKELHPHIQHVSLDINIGNKRDEADARNSLIGFFRCISRNLDLSTVILWIFISEKQAEQIRLKQGELPWSGVAEAVRGLVVRKSMEIQVVVIGQSDVRVDSENGRKIMAEREELGRLMYDILLPDTLRNPVVKDVIEDHMGLIELFEEE